MKDEEISTIKHLIESGDTLSAYKFKIKEITDLILLHAESVALARKYPESETAQGLIVEAENAIHRLKAEHASL